MTTKLPILLTTLSISALVGTPFIAAWSKPDPTPVTQAAPAIPSVAPGANFFADLADTAVPAVVNLSVPSRRPVAGPPLGYPFGPEWNAQPRGTAVGSGFIIDARGLLLTNQHVVADADEVEIQLTEAEGEKPVRGKVVGRDYELDVALVKFDPPRPLRALRLGDSDALRVGEFVMAVGNPYGHGHSVSHGIVSAKGRELPGVPLARYLQTDAPINPGNSGGPLLNTRGEVIGINNAIDARAQGISYAIPINDVKKILTQLKDDGKVSRGYLGATVAPLTPEIAQKLGEDKDLQAALVTDVVLGGPAARAGIRPYDLITEIDGVKTGSPNELIKKVMATPAGDRLEVAILRAGKPLKIKVKVDARPSAELISRR